MSRYVSDLTCEGRLTNPGTKATTPSEADDPRKIRSLAVMRGDVSQELRLLATALGEPASAVIHAGWTLVPFDGPIPVSTVVENGGLGITLGLQVRGNELFMWLANEGVVAGEWQFGASGCLVSSDRLPSGEVGAIALDLIRPLAGGVAPFLEVCWPSLDSDGLGAVLASSEPAGSVVPQLIRALGLHDAARSHLLGEQDLAQASNAIRVEPESSLRVALARQVSWRDWTKAAARSPRRRGWGAVAASAYLVAVVVLGLALLPRLSSEDWDSIWFVTTFIVLGIGVSVAASTIRRWWMLRDPGKLGAEGPPPAKSEWVSRLGRWVDGRVPSTLLALLAAVVFGVGGLLQWLSDEPLRNGGTEVVALVVDISETGARVEWRTSEGRTVTSRITYRGPDLRAGETISVVYDPNNPDHVKAVAELNDASIYVLFIGLAAFCLLAAASIWFRVVDWKRIGDWLR